MTNEGHRLRFGGLDPSCLGDLARFCCSLRSVDKTALPGKLDRLVALRGTPGVGVGAEAWKEALGEAPPDDLLRVVIAAVRELLLPEWAIGRKTDVRPLRAIETAEAWLESKSADNVAQAKAAAKACTEARGETFGQEHRVPEAARHAAWVASGKEPGGLFEALATVEEELLGRIALTGELHRGPEQRRAIVAIVKRVFLPPEAPPVVAPESREPSGPVAYSPEKHFELGQRLTHKKFGEVNVTSVGETWIEVEISDGTKKRLAHKP